MCHSARIPFPKYNGPIKFFDKFCHAPTIAPGRKVRTTDPDGFKVLTGASAQRLSSTEFFTADGVE